LNPFETPAQPERSEATSPTHFVARALGGFGYERRRALIPSLWPAVER
jgi:hypothetical protein